MHSEEDKGNDLSFADLSDDLIHKMELDAGLGLATDEEYRALSEKCDDDPFSGSSFGLPLIEKLILGLIDANPKHPDKHSRRERLNAAIVAITGKAPSLAALPESPDGKVRSEEALYEKALLYMADIRLHVMAKKRYENWMKISRPEERVFTGKKISTNKLATLAAKKFFPTRDPHVEKNTISKLSRTFDATNRVKTRDGSGYRGAEINSLSYQVKRQDYVRDTVEYQLLKRIKADLAQAGVQLSLPES